MKTIATEVEANGTLARRLEAAPVAPASPVAAKKAQWLRPVVLVAIALSLGAGAFMVLRLIHRGLPEGLIQANGRIEGDRVSVASKFPGRIAKLLVGEGDSVTNGQVLGILEERQVQAKVSQARAAFAALGAQLKAAKTSLEVLKKDVPLGIEIADAGVANARAVLA